MCRTIFYVEKLEALLLSTGSCSAVAVCTVLLEQLQGDELPLPRVGAVALGGLAGFVLGLRRRWPRRILYTAIGATAMAALCYPREGAEFVQQSHAMAKKYITITYNFIYGVKPEGLKLPTPEKLLASLGGATEVAKPEMQPSQPSSPQASPGPQTSKQNPPSTSAVVADGGLKARFESSGEEYDDVWDKEEFHIPVQKRACYCLDPNEEGHTTPPLPCKPQSPEKKKGEGGEGVAEEDEGEGSVYVVDGKCRGTPPASPNSQPKRPSLDQIAEDAADIMYWGFRFIHR